MIVQIINCNFFLRSISNLKVITGTVIILTFRRAVQGRSEKSKVEIYPSNTQNKASLPTPVLLPLEVVTK